MRHLLYALLFVLPVTAWAQSNPTPQTLTEAEALRHGLARPDLANLDESSLGMAKADALAAGILPNPTLEFSRDKGREISGSTEDIWRVSQTLDISGRRSLRRNAAEIRVEATRASNAQRRAELTAEIRRRFHETLFRKEVVRVTEAWSQRFARIEGIVAKLAKAGEASGYDRRRLARERKTTEARLNTEQADLDRSSERLNALVGMANTSVTGRLLPSVPVSLQDALPKLEQRPDLQALARRADAAKLDGRAASRGWIPDVTVGIGTRRTDYGGTRENGTLVSVSVPIPLFDRQQSGDARAAAEALNARSEYNIARYRAEGELRGLHRQLERLVTTATDYRAKAVVESSELLRIAEAAYQGGESSLLELLDAYRGTLETEITALELEWKARQARIEYDQLTGKNALWTKL